VTRLAHAVGTFVHTFQSRIYFAQKTSQAGFRWGKRNGCFQAALPLLQLVVQESYFERCHDKLLPIKFYVSYSITGLRIKSQFRPGPFCVSVTIARAKSSARIT
jgi:hypothetical protein